MKIVKQVGSRVRARVSLSLDLIVSLSPLSLMMNVREATNREHVMSEWYARIPRNVFGSQHAEEVVARFHRLNWNEFFMRVPSDPNVLS